MTPVEIAAWGGFAVLVIGALGGQAVLIINALNKVREHLAEELSFARKREYAIQEDLTRVGQAAESAYLKADHGQAKIAAIKEEIAALNQRLIEQGKLAEQAIEVLPHVQQTIEETKALAKELHEKIEPAPDARKKDGG